jgi:hypothetical protein
MACAVVGADGGADGVRPTEFLPLHSAVHDPVIGPSAVLLSSPSRRTVQLAAGTSSKLRCVSSVFPGVVASRGVASVSGVAVQCGVALRSSVALRLSVASALHQSPKSVLTPALIAMQRAAAATKCVRIARRLAALAIRKAD